MIFDSRTQDQHLPQLRFQRFQIIGFQFPIADLLKLLKPKLIGRMVLSLGAVWWGNDLAWNQGVLYYFTWANGCRIVKK
jgi:hypothetical protein